MSAGESWSGFWIHVLSVTMLAPDVSPQPVTLLQSFKVRGPNPWGQQIKPNSALCCLGVMIWTHRLQQSSHFGCEERLVRHVNAELWRWDEVFPGTLCDHHARLLVEHGGDLWRWLRDGQILGRLRVLAALEVIGDVSVLPQEGEELQQEVAEVLPNTKPP